MMFQYSSADIQTQLDALPTLMRAWFGWLGLIVLLAPLSFVRRRQGRIALIFSAVFIPALLVIIHSSGITYVISWLHLLLWVPLLAYLAREVRVGRIAVASPLGVWTLITVCTLVVSLVFDLRDGIRWLAGERGIINPQPSIYLPFVTIPAMILAFALTAWYLGPAIRGTANRLRPGS